MRFQTLAASAAFIGAAVAVVSCGGSTASSSTIPGLQRAADSRSTRCATKPASPAFIASMDRDLATVSSSRAGGTVSIPVYVHVVTNNGAGNVTNSQITRQIDVLNRSFDGRSGGPRTRFTFRHVSTDRVSNPAWHAADLDTPEEREMKTALHRGNAGTLNLYITEGDGETLGFATFPSDYAKDPLMDGVVLKFDTLPGGTNVPYNLGDTAPHEVGHWLGLFHTFENGCTQPGDGVGDTSAEAERGAGCPRGQDTCPSPGADPIENFMDYTADSCMFKFSNGQVSRMSLAWDRYRAR